MGEMDNGLGYEPLNFDNWTIEVNDAVVEKVEQQVALQNWMKSWSDLAKESKKYAAPNIEMTCDIDGRIDDIVFGNENDSLDGFDVQLNYEIGKLPRKLKKAMKCVADGIGVRRRNKWINRWMFVRKRYKSYLLKNCRLVGSDVGDMNFDDSTLTMTMEYSEYERN